MRLRVQPSAHARCMGPASFPTNNFELSSRAPAVFSVSLFDRSGFPFHQRTDRGHYSFLAASSRLPAYEYHAEPVFPPQVYPPSSANLSGSHLLESQPPAREDHGYFPLFLYKVKRVFLVLVGYEILNPLFTDRPGNPSPAGACRCSAFRFLRANLSSLENSQLNSFIP